MMTVDRDKTVKEALHREYVPVTDPTEQGHHGICSCTHLARNPARSAP
jgi:hypothetical protein